MKERQLRDGDLYEYRFQYKSKRSAARFVCWLLVVVLAAFSFRMWWTSHYGGVYVDGPSMMNTLRDEDELLMRYGSDAERGDVIIVDVRKYSLRSGSGEKIEFLIKRLIATEGDTVYCKNSRVYLKKKGEEDFRLLDEPYAYRAADYSFGVYEVGEGEIFFLGDNRTNSMDSRYKEGLSEIDGLYKRTDIYGIVPSWAIRYKELLKYIPGMRLS